MVAHRLSTVMRADEIIVLGKDDEDEVCSSILERGTHFDLLRAEGKYAEMWEAQTNHEEEIPGEGKTIVSDVSTPERDGDSA